MEDWKQLVAMSASGVEDDDIRKTQYHDPVAPWKPPLNSTASEIYHEDYDSDIFINQKEENNPTLIAMETCAEHVIDIWDVIGNVIAERLIDGSGTKIPGFGAFTYYVVGDTKSKNFYYKKPVLILSDIMSRMYKIKSAFNESLSAIPIVGINMKEIATSLQVPQHIVDGVVTEILQAFALAVVCDKNVEFPFPNLGKLQLTKGDATFKFYEKFVISLNSDSDLEKLEMILEDDPAILPGSMTPLQQNIPSPGFASVFHLRDVKSMRQVIVPPTLPMNKSRRNFFASTLQVNPITKCQPFDIENLYGPMLRNYYTITWKREKRNYLQPKPIPWPPHNFHVVDSAIALDKQEKTSL